MAANGPIRSTFMPTVPLRMRNCCWPPTGTARCDWRCGELRERPRPTTRRAEHHSKECRMIVPKRSGFTLLEVILAMTILAGAMAVLGEVGRLALKNASAAKDLARGATWPRPSWRKSRRASARPVPWTRRPSTPRPSARSGPACLGLLNRLRWPRPPRRRRDLGPRDGHPRRAGRSASREVLGRQVAAGSQLHVHAAHFQQRQRQQFFLNIQLGRIVTCPAVLRSWK